MDCKIFFKKISWIYNYLRFKSLKLLISSSIENVKSNL